MQTRTRAKPGRPRNESLWALRREQILDAAAEVFARHGYRATDVQFVADALQVGKGTIYRYFPSKEELFLAAVDRGMRRLTERFQARVHTIADPLERAERGVAEYLTFFQEHPQYVELLIQERAEFRDRKQSTYFVHRDANRGPWQELFHGLIAAGRVRDLSVDGLCDVLSDLVYGTMFSNYFVARRQARRRPGRGDPGRGVSRDPQRVRAGPTPTGPRRLAGQAAGPPRRNRRGSGRP